jgi:hypothetical protein
MYKNAKSRLTGEWIMYMYDKLGRKVYLTLALHQERESAIHARLASISKEIPLVLERLRDGESSENKTNF